MTSGDDRQERVEDVTASHQGAWTISGVEGRGSTPARGLPPVHSMTLAGEDGADLSIERIRGSKEFKARKLREAPYVEFDRCPICEEPGPTSKEHVPPRGLGGAVRTLTCVRCNNEFGSRFEGDLQDWFDDATRVRFSSDGIQGERKGPRVLLRRNQDGAPVFVLDSGKFDPAIDEMFESGTFAITHTLPSDHRVRIALLKSAYLAACCVLGVIPPSPRAAEIRRLLVQVRDAPRGDALPPSPLLDDLAFHRSYAAATAGLWLVGWEEGDEITIGLSLAGTVVVSWPLEPFQVVRIPVPDPDATAAD